MIVVGSLISIESRRPLSHCIDSTGNTLLVPFLRLCVDFSLSPFRSFALSLLLSLALSLSLSISLSPNLALALAYAPELALTLAHALDIRLTQNTITSDQL